jgi:cytidylate kinase
MADFDVIALDGPGGVGKSSTARALAERLGYFFLSSGRIYRALAWSALRRGWRPGTALEPALPGTVLLDTVLLDTALLNTVLLNDVHVELDAEGGLWVNGEAPGDALADEEISQAASQLSTLPAVRALADRVQRDTVAALRRAGHVRGVILEGRDIGTVVFPEARHKFFVTATPAVRAERRHRELARADPSVTLAEVARALEERDRRDSERELAPLRPAPDARVVDTSGLTLEQVVRQIAAVVRGAVRPGDAEG